MNRATLPAPILPMPLPATQQWPRTLPVTAPEAVKKPLWSEAEIAVAQARCVAIFKGLDVVAVGAAPLKEDSECGAPAPIELVSVGKNPQVTFFPTITVTCDMAAALHKWIVGDLQPLAKKHLGAPLVRVDTMSSYSCRNAYGRTKSRLSEHGKANAVDIRAFTTVKAETSEVLADWGPTVRDVQAQVAAAKADAMKREAARAAEAAKAAVARNNLPATAVPGTNPVATGAIRPTLPPETSPTAAALDGSSQPQPGGQPNPTPVPGISVQLPGFGIGLSTGFPSANRLGGPKKQATKEPSPPAESLPAIAPAIRGTDLGLSANSNKTKFLRDAHVSACRIFGTVLGPEANNAHRNHFHVDMAERATTSFCE